MEADLKATIERFLEEKKTFNNLLKANAEKFEPTVFAEFTDTKIFSEFRAKYQGDKHGEVFDLEIHPIFKSYILEKFAK